MTGEMQWSKPEELPARPHDVRGCRTPLPSLRPSLLQALAGAAQESGAWRLTPDNTLSDRDDADSRVASAQQPEISGTVRQDEASAEADRRGDHKGADGQLAPSVGIGEEVSGVAGG